MADSAQLAAWAEIIHIIVTVAGVAIGVLFLGPIKELRNYTAELAERLAYIEGQLARFNNEHGEQPGRPLRRWSDRADDAGDPATARRGERQGPSSGPTDDHSS